MIRFLLLTCSTLALSLVPTPLLAQQQKLKAPEPIELRFLPLGQPPTSEIVVDEKLGSIEKEIDKSLLPPSPLFVLKPLPPGVAKTDYSAIRLSLGVLSLPVKTLPKAGAVTLFAKVTSGESTSYKPWASVKIPAGAKQGLLLLDKAPGNKTWVKPRLKYLNNDSAEFPAGSIRVINTTKFAAIVEVNGAGHPMKSGEMKVIPGGGETTKYRVSMGTKSKSMKIANSAIRLSGSARAMLVISPETKPRSKRPARVKVYRDE